MLSWCSTAIGAVEMGGRLIAGLRGEGRVVRGASPDSLPIQELAKLHQRRNRDTRGAECHPAARSGIEHPGRHHDYDARRHFHMNDITAEAPFPMFTTKPLPKKGVPAVMDLDYLLDMGRMTL